MANHLKEELQQKIMGVFSLTGSLSATAREMKVSRNTVRRLIRTEGLNLAPLSMKSESAKNDPNPKRYTVDFSFLEKIFEAGRPDSETINFKDHLMALTNGLAKDLSIEGNALDVLRLEMAMQSLIVSRRFYLKSLKSSDELYDGPWMKRHDKLVKAVNGWVEIYQKSLDTFLKIMNQLEMRNRKATTPMKGSFVFANQAQVNVGS